MAALSVVDVQVAERSTPAWRLSLLGRLELCRDGSPVVVSISAQRLLAFVSLHGASTRGLIAGSLWPSVGEKHAHGSLRSAIWRVGRSYPGLLSLSGDVVGLGDRVRVDVHHLRRRLRAIFDDVPVDEPLAGSVLDRELLPGWYDDWVLFERERLRQLRLHALESMATRLADDGRYGSAIEAALAAVEADPLRESAHRAVVYVHVVEGNMTEALRQYRRCRTIYRRELGVEPSPLITSLLPRFLLEAATG
jgi:DNA-binding SARP family transcriptional activator